jgi:type I restriction enzyme S subunit
LKFINGGTRAKLNQSDLREIEILSPPIPEQKKIASILTSVDEVIENTQKQIDKLQDLKKATMNELLTKGIGHTEFTDSELGQIPKSWEVAPLGQLAKIQTGIAKNSKKIEDSIVVPYLRVANVQDGYLDLTEIKTIEIPKSKFNRYLLQKGDVLMNEGGDFDKLGRGTVWQNEIADCVHQNHVFAVRPDQTVLIPEYLKFLAGSDYGKRYFINNSKQSTNLASINSSQLKEMPIPRPSVAEQKCIIMNLKVIESLIELRQKTFQQTQSLKKSLMQVLLTGKVRVQL